MLSGQLDVAPRFRSRSTAQGIEDDSIVLVIAIARSPKNEDGESPIMSTPDSNTPSSSDETGDSQEKSATVIGLAEASRSLDTTRATLDSDPKSDLDSSLNSDLNSDLDSENDAADTSDTRTKGSGRRLPDEHERRRALKNLLRIH